MYCHLKSYFYTSSGTIGYSQRFRDSGNILQYIAFFRAYLDTILKALGAPLLSSAPSRKQTSHTFYSPGGRNYLLTFSSKEKEIDN